MGQAAVDAQSGQLVVLTSSWGWGTVQPTSYDVCTNTWKRQGSGPWTDKGWGGPTVVYDPGKGAILALTVSETKRTRASSYSSASGQWSETIVPQKLVPWAYSVDIDTWALLPTIEFPPGFESASLTHAALDPTTGQVLFLMEAAGSRTLWSYSPGWRTLTQLGGQVPAGRSGDPALILDARARRLVLVLWGPSSTIPGETWTFDLLSQKWTDQQATPPRLPFEESNWPVLDFRREAAFDPVSQRTFVLMGGQLATYQTGSHQWDVVYPGPGWPSKVRPLETESGGLAGPLARAGHSLVYDPVNQRMLVYGGTWLTTEGKTHTGDVWAYDVPTNTWTELVRPVTQEQ